MRLNRSRSDLVFFTIMPAVIVVGGFVLLYLWSR